MKFPITKAEFRAFVEARSLLGGKAKVSQCPLARAIAAKLNITEYGGVAISPSGLSVYWHYSHNDNIEVPQWAREFMNAYDSKAENKLSKANKELALSLL